MKKQLLFLLISFSFSIAGLAQHALNSLSLNHVGYDEIPTNANGSLDINNGFTFEAWINTFGATDNQKVAGKIGGDFKNGFIYGIEDLQVNLEVFDNNGTNTKLKAGNISLIGWTHVAGTYEVGGKLVIYVNGKKVGETAASSALHEANTSPFRIGIAPWDVNALGYFGLIDEVRYWNTVLDEATIWEWMHKDVVDTHPNFADLGMYHKYNQQSTTTMLDGSVNQNHGTLSSPDDQRLEPLNLPFKGSFNLYENEVQGVWNAKKTGSSDILMLEAFFADTLDIAQSALFSNSDGDYSISNIGGNGFTGRMEKTWRATSQGDLFLVDLHFDLNAVDLTGQGDPILLVSDDEDFSDATIVAGQFSGGIFSVIDQSVADGTYYTIGFQAITATSEPESVPLSVTISPNPNDGAFYLDFDKTTSPLEVAIFDLQGKTICRAILPAGQHRYNMDFQEILGSGLYILRLVDENGHTSAQKFLVK